MKIEKYLVTGDFYCPQSNMEVLYKKGQIVNNLQVPSATQLIHVQPLSSAKWAIKRTPENAEVVNKWLISQNGLGYDKGSGYCHSDSKEIRNQLQDDYTEIDFEIFKEITGIGEEKPKQLLGEKEAVHCPTLELAEKVIDIFRKNGVNPRKNAREYLDEETNLCFILTDSFAFCNKGYYEKEGYTIIPAEQFIKDNEQKQSEKEVPKFKKGDTVVIRQCSKETHWYADKIGQVFVLEAERPSGNWVIKGSLYRPLNPYDIQKIFTIEDVRNGKCAIENDGQLKDIKLVLSLCFPHDMRRPTKNDVWNFYSRSEHIKNSWMGSRKTDLPTQSVKLFLSQIEGEKEPTTEEWQPKWGEPVEVSDDGKDWVLGKFVGLSPSNNRPVVEYDLNETFSCTNSFGYIRQPTHTFTTEQAKQDLAKLHNLNVNQVKILE